ncbi:MAG TPA: permease-like cell division protein FtsX [Mycobacteriales bacterium]
MRPRFVLSEIGNGLRRNVTMAVAVVVTVMISLAFVGASILATNVADNLHAKYYGKLEVAIYLKSDISPAEQTALREQLETDPRVKAYEYVSHAQALTQFRADFADSPDLINSVQNGDVLPASFQVGLKNPKLFQDIQAEYSYAPGVDNVYDPQQLLEPLFQLIDGVKVLAIIVAVVSGAAALLTTFNTIRLAAFSRRREIGIMRLVGASNFTIQLPFVLEGMIAGFVGALAAGSLLVVFKRWVLDGTLKGFFASHVIPEVAWSDVGGVMPWLIIAGILVAAAASYVTSLVYVRI